MEIGTDCEFVIAMLRQSHTSKDGLCGRPSAHGRGKLAATCMCVNLASSLEFHYVPDHGDFNYKAEEICGVHRCAPVLCPDAVCTLGR